MPNPYNNLPNELIFNIESFLNIKPKDVKKMIENPPMKYKKMLDQVCGFVDSKTWSLVKADSTQEEVDEKNEKIKIIRTNFIKFFIEFDVKSISKWGLSNSKAQKHGFIKSRKETFSFQTSRAFKHLDHVKEFTTYDKKHIVISSPYTETCQEHLKYGFKKYHTSLYEETAQTYYLILE